MSEDIPSQEQYDEKLLSMLNDAVASLGEGRWKKFPQLEALKALALQCPALKGKRIAIVDDSGPLLFMMAPYLTAVTGVKPELFLFEQHDMEDTARRMAATNPDVILVDYRLGEERRGTGIVEALRTTVGFKGIVLGFSSDQDAIKAFESAGASGSSLKDTLDEEGTMLRLSKTVAALERTS